MVKVFGKINDRKQKLKIYEVVDQKDKSKSLGYIQGRSAGLAAKFYFANAPSNHPSKITVYEVTPKKPQVVSIRKFGGMK